MISGTCHCGAVRLQIPRRPRTLTNCNCSICRRYGTLWAYYQAAEVTVDAEPGATHEYVWGDRMLKFVRCAHCGCVVCWRRIVPGGSGRMGVNARNFDPALIGPAPIRLLDGADTWKFLDPE